MKIAIFEIEPWERQAFEGLEGEHDLVYENGRLDDSNVGKFADADIVSTFIHSSLSREVLERFSGLKLIATRSTGFDHIDLDTCRDKGIQVANVPTYGDNTVAEHVFALLLAISHNVVHAVDRTRRGDFSLEGLDGFDLQGKTMGVIGTGGIGQHTARIAKGFGMEVLAFDVAPREAIAREIGFTYVGMSELLSRSDVVSLHVPGNDETKDLISTEQFETMKHGAVLINTARGSVVDTEAMLRALASGKLRAAGLDVLAEEPAVREEAELLRSYFRKAHNLEALLANHILLRMRNVIITPHSAFNTREAVQRILKATRDNIDCFIRGEPCNIVEGALSNQGVKS
ncbi:MAG: hydroxyacid dehydrogenase [Phycisphaeraceae bacterium]